jgi:hypothetical protein
MVHRYLKIYLFVSILFWDFVMFADDPGTGFEDENGNTDGSVETAVPINGKILWLIFMGIVFAFLFLKKQKRDTAST